MWRAMTYRKDILAAKTLILTVTLSASSTVFAAAGGIPGAPTGNPNKGSCSQNLVVTPVPGQSNIDFGSFDAGPGGTLIVNPDGTRSPGTPAPPGGINAINTSTTQAAAFDVSRTLIGCSAFPVSITLPTSATISNGASTMTLSTFTSDQPGNSFTIPDGVTVTVHIGATITAVSGQAQGAYTSTTPYSVTFK